MPSYPVDHFPSTPWERTNLPDTDGDPNRLHGMTKIERGNTLARTKIDLSVESVQKKPRNETVIRSTDEVSGMTTREREREIRRREVASHGRRVWRL
jgi:hypothetical protein